MADLSQDHLIEQILVRSDVKDLIRFRSVCRSWDSLIRSPRFINRHLQHNYHTDRYNNKLSNRRITLVVDFPACYKLVGSSNGLVFLIYHCNSGVLVGNPLTRHVRQLRSTPAFDDSPVVCKGFGYDSIKDDYKVILGLWNMSETCFRVLSLKKDYWRFIGRVRGRFLKPNSSLTWITKDGILCNSSLHWIMRDAVNMNIIIITYYFSKEEFREVSQPDDERYQCTSENHLTVIEECLCIYTRSFSSVDAWLMKDFDVKQSWELMRYNQEMKCDIVHYMKASIEYHIPYYDFLRADESRSNKTLGFIDAPVRPCISLS